jgi:hypothetical protein
MGAPARQDDVSGDRRTGGWRRHLSYSNVAATLALVFAMGGGTAIAAQKLITGEQIAKGTITADNIKAHSLRAKDFKARQLPSGARGPAGPAGATGGTGPAGTPGVPGAPGTPGANGSTVFWGDLRGTGSNPRGGLQHRPHQRLHLCHMDVEPGRVLHHTARGRSERSACHQRQRQ